MNNKLQVTSVYGDVGENTPNLAIVGKLGANEVRIFYEQKEEGASKAYISGYDTITASYLDVAGQEKLKKTHSAQSEALPNNTLEQIATGEIEIVPAPVEKRDALAQSNPDYFATGIKQMKKILSEFKIPEKGEVKWPVWAVAKEGVMIRKEARSH